MTNTSFAEKARAAFTELLACFLVAVGLSMFLAPNNIVAGGVSGIATVLYTAFGIPVGVSTLLLNIPLVIIGLMKLGRDFMLRTLRVVVICSVLTDLTAAVLPVYRSELVLTAGFGGALMGAGLGLVFLQESSTGGVDIVVKLMQKRWPHLSFGSLMVLTDVGVIAAAALIFSDLDLFVIGIFQMIVAGFVSDRLIMGFDERRMVTVVTRCADALTVDICNSLSRGVTVLDAQGGYTGEKSSVLLCVVEGRELSGLKRLVYKHDPDAFMIVSRASETIGNGFKPLEQ